MLFSSADEILESCSSIPQALYTQALLQKHYYINQFLSCQQPGGPLYPFGPFLLGMLGTPALYLVPNSKVITVVQ